MLDQLTELHAGSLTALLDGVDLRYLRTHGVEVFRRVYVAVRDRDWGTIPGVVHDVHLEEHADRFELTFAVSHHAGEIDYVWRGTITGATDGSITYRMDGTANRAFEYSRIGFCILHPDEECAGQVYSGESPAGPIHGRLPDMVAPQPFVDGFYVPLIPPITSLSIALRSGGRAHLECTGDLFETEDQRNWTDASYKTYCTPMGLGFPFQAHPGQAFTQQIRLSASGVREPAVTLVARDEVELRVGLPSGRRMSAIGLGPTSALTDPDEVQRQVLRALRAQHLRVDVRLDDPQWRATAQSAVDLAHEMSWPLELAVFTRPTDDLAEAATMFDGVSISRLLVFSAGAETATPEETTPVEAMRRVRREFAPALGNPPVGGGTDMYFCELNRTRPDVSVMECVAFSIMPQEHASDELSLVETLRAEAETIHTARAFSADRPIAVSPVTLLPRGPHPRTDPRQGSLFTAAWTAGSIKYLAEAGTDSVSYFEPTGDRGVVTTGGQPTPTFHVLSWAVARSGEPVRHCNSDDHMRVIGLALGDGHRAETVLVVNLSPRPVDCTVTGAIEAHTAVEQISGESDVAGVDADAIRLRLGPHAVASLAP